MFPFVWHRRDSINVFLIKQTTGGPKRFRPKTMEELQNEVAELETKYKKAMTAGATGGRRMSGQSGIVSIFFFFLSRQAFLGAWTMCGSRGG